MSFIKITRLAAKMAQLKNSIATPLLKKESAPLNQLVATTAARLKAGGNAEAITEKEAKKQSCIDELLEEYCICSAIGLRV